MGYWAAQDRGTYILKSYPKCRSSLRDFAANGFGKEWQEFGAQPS